MTTMREYKEDMEKVWSAVILIGSIVLATLTILVAHLIWGR
uniref:Uncharacterized protein n=1 Tax=viral metagenome TaxID=1070528 RepID=A0A6M3LMR6_9ZZZZ